MAAMWRNEKQKQKAKFAGSLFDIMEQICLKNLNSGECCEGNCASYNLDECIHPDKAIPQPKK